MSQTRKIFLFIALPLVVIFGVVSYFVVSGDKQHAATPTVQSSSPNTTTQTTQSTASDQLIWQQGPEGWVALSTAPACPDPLTLKLPANISLVTAILYPGQTRGGNYKPHGGLRFDNSKNADITVSAPMDAFIVRGARYLVDGEIQYTFDFMNNCGIMYRLGHLLVLTPKYAALAEKFPAATEGNSRTENIQPPIAIKQGEQIATSVGITKGGVNTFFDWGVYDFRAKNEASQDTAWATKHQEDRELAPHAVCWFNLLSASDSAAVKSLPAGDPTSGKNSDYCK